MSGCSILWNHVHLKIIVYATRDERRQAVSHLGVLMDQTGLGPTLDRTTLGLAWALGFGAWTGPRCKIWACLIYGPGLD